MSNISTDFSTWSTTPASNQPDSGDAATIQSDLQRIQAALRIIMPNVNAALTPTHTELNYVDGVTSAIQTQLNAKVSTSGATFVGAVAVPDDAYAVGWNGSANVPTKNAVYDKIESILDGQAFTGDITVPDEAYGVGWNGSLEVPTKNAVYDKIETIGTSFSSNITTTGGTAIEFTGTIPTSANEFTVHFKGFSTNGASPFILQVGVGGVYVTTGYESFGTNLSTVAIAGASQTAGMALANVVTAAASYSGHMTFKRTAGTNTWTAVGGLGSGSGVAGNGWGSIDAGGVLDSVRWTTVGGANTVDLNGGVSVTWRS